MFVIIVGGGRVGAHLASLLIAGGHGVRVIEVSREESSRLRRELPPESVIQGSGTDPLVLERSGIRDANVLAAVTGLDENNLVAASLARFEFGVPRVMARVNDPGNAWLFNSKMGVDVSLNQADLLAHLIVEEMSVGEMMTLLKLRKGEYSLVEEKVHPESVASGKSLSQLDLPRESVIAAVIRRGKLLIPRGDLVLHPGDEVLAVVHSVEMGRLAMLLGPGE